MAIELRGCCNEDQTRGRFGHGESTIRHDPLARSHNFLFAGPAPAFWPAYALSNRISGVTPVSPCWS